jgi:hypothetical protein
MITGVKSQPHHRAAARRCELPAFAAGVATAIDIVAAGLLIAGPISWGICGMALTLHLIAAGSLVLRRRLRGSRRALLLAFGVALPIVGAAAVILALAQARPEDGPTTAGIVEEDQDREEVTWELDESLPTAEALVVAGTEERRAILSALGRRADADAVAVLRWALTAASTELGRESALALEDLSSSFERRLDGHRRALELAPTHAEAMAAGQWIAHGLNVGIIDVVQMPTFASEARRYFVMARALRPEAAADVALAQAQMELAVLRPDTALELLDEALAHPAREGEPARHDELRRLRDEAALRSHDLPWEGPSLLATYRHELPARRHAARHGASRTARLTAAPDQRRTAQRGMR